MDGANTALPGDDLVPDPSFVIDRSLHFAASPEAVWPWLVQLGKARAGWYLPRRVERAIPVHRRAARRIVPAYQRLSIGQDVPDWGPGTPVFRVAELQPPRALVYLSVRDPQAGWGWPTDEASSGVLRLSWALVLDEAAGGSLLRIRLRVRRGSSRFAWLVRTVGGFIDWLTIVGLHRGLAERLR
jgi:hypothetical protein